jgi:hypothetical protein
MTFVAYAQGVTGHPADEDVMLNVMSLADKKVKVLAKSFGGQGTNNVPSWSPDSTKVAFVSYEYLTDGAREIEAPAYHTTEDGRWDYRVTIRYKNSAVATTANPDEEAFIKQLWPDQDTYKREEQRRFEILAGHWDLPVTDITPR